MDTQMKFNEANNKSLQRLTDRDNESNKKIEIMIGNMHDCLNQGGYSERPMSLKTPDRKRIPLTALDKARYCKMNHHKNMGVGLFLACPNQTY